LIRDVLKLLEGKSVKAFKIAKERLSTESMRGGHLRKALGYYENNWNDVLHPGIIAIACEAVGGSGKDSILMQVPMLFFTAAADVHDDIIDGSQLKNGRPTIFGKFGKDIALLVGDRMLFKGTEALYVSGKRIAGDRMDLIVKAIDSAFVEVGEAHSSEIRFKGELNLNPKEYFCMLEKKSAVLEAHTRIGALIGNGTEKEVETLAEYGRTLGTLMTLRDEFIDLFEPQELSDRLKNGCLPLPMIYAFEDPAVKKSVMEILKKPRISKKDSDIIVDFAFEDQNVKRLKKEMGDLSGVALELANDLGRSKDLELIIDTVLEKL
jgi:geranylgeranyl pyrophosphate synthase